MVLSTAAGDGGVIPEDDHQITPQTKAAGPSTGSWRRLA